VKPFNTGDSGPQWLGWFRREINSIDDFRGLRFRTAGLGGEMFRRAGASVVTLPAGRSSQALQSGTIDAAEFLGPMSDAPLGLHQVTKNYYFPGVQEPSSAEEIGINMARWNALPDDLKQAVGAFACQSVAEEITTEYDANHPACAGRTRLPPRRDVREVPRDVLIALGNSAGEILAEFRATRTRWSSASRIPMRSSATAARPTCCSPTAATSTPARCRSAGAERCARC
jgi:TRAP-type mannitol/chloroaromatic compound transport system substrate-binding protein